MLSLRFLSCSFFMQILFYPQEEKRWKNVPNIGYFKMKILWIFPTAFKTEPYENKTWDRNKPPRLSHQFLNTDIALKVLKRPSCCLCHIMQQYHPKSSIFHPYTEDCCGTATFFAHFVHSVLNSLSAVFPGLHVNVWVGVCFTAL